MSDTLLKSIQRYNLSVKDPWKYREKNSFMCKQIINELRQAQSTWPARAWLKKQLGASRVRKFFKGDAEINVHPKDDDPVVCSAAKLCSLVRELHSLAWWGRPLTWRVEETLKEFGVDPEQFRWG